MIKKIITSTLFKLVLAVVVGLLIGPYVGVGVMNVVITIKHLLGQLIFFFVPLIILAFIGSSIAGMGRMASKLLGLALILAYLSSIGAAFMAMGLGYAIIPQLNIKESAEVVNQLPNLLFELNIPPVMSVMTALALAIMVGLSAVWSNSIVIVNILSEFQKMVLLLVKRVLIPVLPLFIAANFCILSYEGALVNQLPIFINVMGIVLIAHIVWLAILYTVAAIISKKNPWEVVRYYAPPYFTAIGTMSSAATLPVSLDAARRSSILKKRSIDFAIPLFSNIHLCGSILTEVFFVMTVSQLLYGTLPSVGTMVLFIILLAVFAIGAPGVPGGTVIASLGIVISVLGFDEVGTALLLTIFALQDSFGTACNVVGDGALTMIVSKYERE
ncbi:MAG: cation:dicarboxylase symporter family transporter [Bacteroidales bacterium]